MTINDTYKAPTNITVNYDWVDIAAGTGYIVMYGGSASSNAVVTYHLNENTFWSDNVLTRSSFAQSTTSWSLNHDLDFDLQFSNPRTVHGRAGIQIPTNMDMNTTSKDYYYYNKVIIKKVVKGVETELGSSSGAVVVYKAGPAETPNKSYLDMLYLQIPHTVFKAGEVLRLTIQNYGKVSAGCDCEWLIGHDPKNRATSNKDGNTFETGAVTNLLVYLPFHIQVV